MIKSSKIIPAMKVYCERHALSKEIKSMQSNGLIDLIHFPYDPPSQPRTIRHIACPSKAQVRDLHISVKELPGTIADYSGSAHLEVIRSIIGRQHRRDALHIDSAFKTDCPAFVTKDSDILDHKRELESLLGIRFFHPEKDRDALQEFVSRARVAQTLAKCL